MNLLLNCAARNQDHHEDRARVHRCVLYCALLCCSCKYWTFFTSLDTLYTYRNAAYSTQTTGHLSSCGGPAQISVLFSRWRMSTNERSARPVVRFVTQRKPINNVMYVWNLCFNNCICTFPVLPRRTVPATNLSILPQRQQQRQQRLDEHHPAPAVSTPLPCPRSCPRPCNRKIRPACNDHVLCDCWQFLEIKTRPWAYFCLSCVVYCGSLEY